MKDIRLEIRLTPYEALQLQQACDRRGMNKSELIRSLIARLPEPILAGDSSSTTVTVKPAA